MRWIARTCSSINASKAGSSKLEKEEDKGRMLRKEKPDEGVESVVSVMEGTEEGDTGSSENKGSTSFKMWWSGLLFAGTEAACRQAAICLFKRV